MRKITTQIDWPCEVKTLFREKNLGCKIAVSSAITWFFENVEQGIILEDDCLPNQSFFVFCEQMLELYKDDQRIMHISGDNFDFGQKRGNADYYFSKLNHIWGWATWKRAWKHYDLEMPTLEEFIENNYIKDIFNDKEIAKKWINNFKKAKNGKVNTWDYQWTYTIWSKNGLAIIPSKNLVKNIGFGYGATHTKTKNQLIEKNDIFSLSVKKHPDVIIRDYNADIHHYKIMRVNIIKRIYNKIIQLNNNFCYKMMKKNKLIFKDIIQYQYNKILDGLYSGKKSKLYLVTFLIFKKIFKKLDPEIKVKIGNKYMFMNMSHTLPINYYRFSNYDRALPRICEKLKNIDNKLYVVDIGANIGDTVSLITDIVSGNFLCIEGDEKFIPFLEKNTKQIDTTSNILIERCYCGNETEEKMSIDRANGTAKIIKTDVMENNKNVVLNLEIRSLDKIIENYPDFKDSNILKIDTDGFEIDILSSGKQFIKNSKPLLYFEYTPELYVQNQQDPKIIWEILKECGYKEALVYDNFGCAIEIINIDNQEKINELINKIDKKNIYYYDILTYHNSNNKYSKILEAELDLFTKKHV